MFIKIIQIKSKLKIVDKLLNKLSVVSYQNYLLKSSNFG